MMAHALNIGDRQKQKTKRTLDLLAKCELKSWQIYRSRIRKGEHPVLELLNHRCLLVVS